MSLKRENYLEWQEYFMSIAFLSAQRSKDPRTQVGACIVNKDNKIVGIGYNGMPIGCDDDKMPWNRAQNDSKESWFNSKSPFVCHAEMNAVLNKNQGDVKDCTIYVALFPCNVCAQIIVQSGIKEVVYYSDKYHHKFEFKASRHILDTAKVKYRQLRPRQKQVTIQFDMIEKYGGQEPILETVLDESCGNGDILPLSDINSNTICPSKLVGENKNSNAVSEMVNNNNIVKRKKATLFNHALQQNLPQNIGEEQLQNIPETLHAGGIPSSPDILELSFAIYSIMFIAFVMGFTWLLANSGFLIVKT